MITFNEYFIAYLDILGFTKMVRGNDVTKLDYYVENVNEVIKKSFVNLETYSSLIVSDSVIISVPTDNNKETNRILFYKLSYAISELQRKFALVNIWLRGGVSYGEAFLSPDKKNIIGEAYLSALNIEEEYAKFPRVVIDPKMPQFLGFEISQELIQFCNIKISEPNWASRSSLLFDWQTRRLSGRVIQQDVDLFIDYLYPIINNPADFDNLLMILKDNLKLSLEFYPKYRWVIDYLRSCYNRYHNEISSETLAEYQLLSKL